MSTQSKPHPPHKSWRLRGNDRYLVVNADDFGLSYEVSEGIIESHEQGIVTSTSLMVRWPGAEAAAYYGRNHSDLAIGLHVDVGEWAYRDGEWIPLYSVVADEDPETLVAEVRAQLEAFRDLMGRNPTHVDSHQHTHKEEPLKSILKKLAQDHKVPLRHVTPGINYCGSFYGQTALGEPDHDRINIAALLGIIESLPNGITEMACHPAKGIIKAVPTMYREERLIELRVLTDQRVREAVFQSGVRLCSFAQVPPLLADQ